VNDPWWSITTQVFRRYGMPAPDRSPEERGRLPHEFEQLERMVPEPFPALVRNRAFLDLIAAVGGPATRRALRAQLVSRPPAVAALPDPADEPPEPDAEAAEPGEQSA